MGENGKRDVNFASESQWRQILKNKRAFFRTRPRCELNKKNFYF